MNTFSRFVLSALMLGCAASLSLGCSSEVDSNGSSESEIRESDLVLGSYAGTGELTNLALIKTEENKQLFSAKQTVQCIKAPCNAISITGSWFARSGALKLYVNKTTVLEYKYSALKNGTFRLKNAKGNVVADLKKEDWLYGKNSPVITKALKAAKLDKLEVASDPAQAFFQTNAYTNKIGYDDAAAIAVKTLQDTDGDLFNLTAEYLGDGDFEDHPTCSKNTTAATLLRCLLNGGMTLRLDSAASDIPTGETSDAYWIFSLDYSNDEFGDHGIWVSVDRLTGAARTSSFN